ncbi:kinase-like protein, partial [Piedraia hortae CBS 480.64]
LTDKFEIIKDIGDGSFGSVALGRTRSAAATTHLRKGTLVAIKTMKKTFDNFAQCMELREVVFLKLLPHHVHLVPAYDIFLDPISRKLHIAMEYMDGNLYQLIKARNHKPLDGASVKSILFQILSGLEHIHHHQFFHRDIKPENILVTPSSSDPSAFRRYSALVTPPSTPPTYAVKIADFGLAREAHSRLPYTTYVSTRWYRAPEVLLRAGSYSAPVDLWAVGAMAVEVATLKPLFPGGNEVDQVWRVCEIMGSPGNWMNRHGQPIGGGEWKEGVRLAHKLGFSFPKMAPHSIDTLLPTPAWPAELSRFVTWCLMWDPQARPTARQAIDHEYFIDAVDPLRPKSVGTLNSKTSWFRKSLMAREPTTPEASPPLARPAPPVHAHSTDVVVAAAAAKRATWTGAANVKTPIPILPSARPITPRADGIVAQARAARTEALATGGGKKVGRQLSVHSQGNHYADVHRQEAERALNGGYGLKSPTGANRESFFSHLRKRAKRLSGRHQAPPLLASGDEEHRESKVGCSPWPGSNRNSTGELPADAGAADVRNEIASPLREESAPAVPPHVTVSRKPSSIMLKRHHSLPRVGENKGAAKTSVPAVPNAPAVLGKNGSVTKRKPLRPARSDYHVTPGEDELVDDAIKSAHRATHRLDRDQAGVPTRRPLPQPTSDPNYIPYLTPSPSKESNRREYSLADSTSQPMDITPIRKSRVDLAPQWPTPPYEENDWAASAAASIMATQ